MERTLNNISGFLVKSISEIMRYVLVMITILGFLFFNDLKTLNINFVLFFGIVNYGLSYIMADYLKKRSHQNSYMKIIFPIIGIGACIVSVLYLQDIQIPTFKLAVMVVYILLWKKGMDSNINDDDIQTIRKVMLFSLIIISIVVFFAMFVTAFTVTGWYLNMFKIYVPVYLIVTLLYMDRVSRTNAYSRYYTNTINKEKNINRFNIISTSIVVLCLLTIFVGEYSIVLKSGFNVINKVLEIILYPVALLGAKLSSFMEKLFARRIEDIDFKGNNISDEAKKEIAEKWLSIGPDKYGNQIVQIINIFKWILFAIFVGVVGYLLYKNFRELFYTEKENEVEGEEKDFVLPTAKSLSKLKKSFSNLGDRFRRHSNNIKGLPTIRRIYIQMVEKLKDKGYEYKKNYTPNEYLSNIDKEETYRQKGFDIITEYYNKLRYGNKELDENEIKNALEIKEQMDI